MPRFEALLAKAVCADVPLHVAVVGGGPSGVELACALRYRCACALGGGNGPRAQLRVRCAVHRTQAPCTALVTHAATTEDAEGGPCGHACLSLSRLGCLLRRLGNERQAAGITSPMTVSLVSRGRILQGLTPYARRAFLPLLKASLRTGRGYHAQLSSVAAVNVQEAQAGAQAGNSRRAVAAIPCATACAAAGRHRAFPAGRRWRAFGLAGA